MKNMVLWGVLVAILMVVNGLILKKEDTLRDGQTMLLKLAPRDPRSVMQGDYMVLGYEMANQVRSLVGDDLGAQGRLVVALDTNQVARFVRVHKGEPLQPNEHLLFYRNRGGLRLGAESFMFQEGDAGRYSLARYGELKVDSSGSSVLVGLRGEDLQPLGR